MSLPWGRQISGVAQRQIIGRKPPGKEKGREAMLTTKFVNKYSFTHEEPCLIQDHNTYLHSN